MSVANSETLQKLDEVGVQTLSWMEEFSVKGIEFIERQAPLLCDEIIFKGINYHISFMIIWFGIFLISGYFCQKFFLYLKSQKWCRTGVSSDNEDGRYFLLFLTKFLSMSIIITTFVAICNNLYYIYVIYNCPRLYLLEYFNNLI